MSQDSIHTHCKAGNPVITAPNTLPSTAYSAHNNTISYCRLLLNINKLTHADDEAQKSHHKGAFAYPSDNCPEKILHSIFLYSKYTKELRKYVIQAIMKRKTQKDGRKFSLFL